MMIKNNVNEISPPNPLYEGLRPFLWITRVFGIPTMSLGNVKPRFKLISWPVLYTITLITLLVVGVFTLMMHHESK